MTKLKKKTITFAIWLSASFDEPDAVFGELTARLSQLLNLIHAAQKSAKRT